MLVPVMKPCVVGGQQQHGKSSYPAAEGQCVQQENEVGLLPHPVSCHLLLLTGDQQLRKEQRVLASCFWRSLFIVSCLEQD